MGPLDRLGLDSPVLDREVLPTERPPVSRPQGLHQGETLLHARAPPFEGGPVEGELVRLVADGDPQDHATAREGVEQRGLLCETHRVVEGNTHTLAPRVRREVRAAKAVRTWIGAGQ